MSKVNPIPIIEAIIHQHAYRNEVEELEVMLLLVDFDLNFLVVPW